MSVDVRQVGKNQPVDGLDGVWFEDVERIDFCGDKWHRGVIITDGKRYGAAMLNGLDVDIIKDWLLEQWLYGVMLAK